MNKSNLFKGINFSIRSSLKLLGIRTILFIVSCDGGAKTEKTSTSDSANLAHKPAAVNQFYSFKLEKHELEKYLDPANNFKSLTFKFSTDNIKSSDIILSVVSYGIKIPKNPPYPEEPRYNLKQMAASTPAFDDTLYVLGNNYIAIQDIRKYIQDFKDKVDYLRLTYQLSDNPTLKGQIVFLIQAFDIKNVQLVPTQKSPSRRNEPKAPSGIVTDPSPPAPAPSK